MTLEECYQEYERTGKIDGFEGWADCMNYPEYSDLEYGYNFEDIVVEGNVTPEEMNQRYMAELKLNAVFYIMLVAILILVYIVLRAILK